MAAVAGQLGAFGANGASRLASVVFRELVPTAFTAVSSACLGASTTSTSFARDTAVYTSSRLSKGLCALAKVSTTALYSLPCALCTVSAHAGIRSRKSVLVYETSRPPCFSDASARSIVSKGVSDESSPPSRDGSSSSSSPPWPCDLCAAAPPKTTRTPPSPSTATTVPKSPLNTSLV